MPPATRCPSCPTQVSLEKLSGEHLCIQTNYRSNWDPSIYLKSFIYCSQKNQAKLLAVYSQTLLIAVLEHSRVSCCTPEPNMGNHPAKTPAQPPSPEQHDGSAVTVNVSHQGKIKKQLKRKAMFSQVFFFKGEKAHQIPVFSGPHSEARQTEAQQD